MSSAKDASSSSDPNHTATDANAAATADASSYYDPYYYSGYDYSSYYNYDPSTYDASSAYYDPNYYAQYYNTAGNTTTSTVPSVPIQPVAAMDVASQQSTYMPQANVGVAASSAAAAAAAAAAAHAAAHAAASAGATGSPSSPAAKGGAGGPIHVSTSGYAGPNAKPKEEDATSNSKKKGKKKSAPAATVRAAGGEVWEDPTLQDWDDNDYRLFAGDLGNEVTDELLFKAFSKYTSLQRTRVVRDKRTGKTRGYGFLSFRDPNDFVKAWREMNGKYVGNRPIKLRKSSWKERNIDVRARKERERLGPYPKIK
ncbi:hypothetical protein O0I10_012345 [Lichtheimia ornata]|uniref:RRM domain-containing protein n=1 Tax=Lichtheimia ornata TaxID=688661 RepID=A0AAD7URY3_9FUNG|nr:uncharacterized protein O0I10_012345 [Lichtheimia ornata]KAJ8652036.1 hypothetical protein O0I10_012345 [Lichtheimia ornata]